MLLVKSFASVFPLLIFQYKVVPFGTYPVDTRNVIVTLSSPAVPGLAITLYIGGKLYELVIVPVLLLKYHA